MKTSVAVIDGYAMMREMLAMVLTQEGRYEVTGQAESGLDALRLFRKKTPQLVILDLALPEMSGVEVLRYLRSKVPQTRVIIFSAAQNSEMILEALREQPHGYIHKGDSLAAFREALQAVNRGCSYFTPFAMDILNQIRKGQPCAWEALTGRERVVLQMVAEGKSNKEMAMRLFVSVKTVENNRKQVMRKMGLKDVTALTRYAVRRGLVPLE